MSTQPLFELPNYSTTTNGNYSTTRTHKFIIGYASLDVGESLSLAIQNGEYQTSEDWLFYDEEKGRFTIPNPNVYTNGFPLDQGENRFDVRIIDENGNQGAISTIKVRLVDESIIQIQPQSPTGITAEVYDGYVCIKWTNDDLDTDNIIGYNVFCSASSGGGVTGYQQINVYMLDTPIMTRQEVDFAKLDSDVSIATDLEGNPAADPLFTEFSMIQRGLDGVTLRTDINELLEIPESISNVRVQINVSSYTHTENYSFEHYRTYGPNNTPPTIASAVFASTLPSVDLYYVVAAVYIDPISGVEIESPLSVEVAARPMAITPAVGEFPTVSREQLLKDTVLSIYQTNPDIAIQPGSVIRDVVLDPFLNEATRLRMVVDFLYRAGSFSSLLEIDDPLKSGFSVSVAESSYKSALKNAFFYLNSNDLQRMIDTCFDKLALNFGVRRSAGYHARGEVTFYVTSRPTQSIIIPIGTQVYGGSASFRTTASNTMSVENLASFYNPSTKRYSVTLPIKAINPGTSGNVSMGGVSSTELSNVFVTNAAATFGGTDQETNTQLAIRAQNQLSSVDSGTLRGYLQTASAVPGVEESQIVAAGDIFMQRDYDETVDAHIGGCVDIWVRGVKETTVTDTFSFTYETKQDVQFVLADSPNSLLFRALDENLTTLNPIIEMLDVENPKLGFRNASTGAYFDLTNVTIVSPNIIQLDTTIPQPIVDYGDVILGDYRYRTGTEFVLTRQPVREIISVVGSVTETLDPNSYTLHRPSPPLVLGYSSQAKESLIIQSSLDESVPSGNLIEVTDESHVMVGEYIEFLNNMGGIGLTVVVTSADGSTTYKGPYDPSGLMDYTIQEGDQTTPLGIKRVLTGEIEDGEEVLISYKHDENFVVTYKTNLIVSTVQSDVDLEKHLTASVLVKEAIPIMVNIKATVLVQRGTTVSDADTEIRTNLQNLFYSLTMGDPIRQSDIIEVIDSSYGVSYVIVPLTQMCLADGSHIIWEKLNTDQFSDFEQIITWSTGYNNVYLLAEPLNFNTTNGGMGSGGNHTAVCKGDTELTLQDGFPYLLGRQPYQAYIIGKEGLPVPGVSDDETLQALGYVEEVDILAKRKELTANRILISLPLGESPVENDWSVTYTVDSDDGTKDIEVSGISYLTLGEVTLTYDEDRPTTSRIRTSQSTLRY